LKNDKKPFIVIETNNETTLENIVSEMALEAYLKMIEEDKNDSICILKEIKTFLINGAKTIFSRDKELFDPNQDQNINHYEGILHDAKDLTSYSIVLKELIEKLFSHLINFEEKIKEKSQEKNLSLQKEIETMNKKIKRMETLNEQMLQLQFNGITIEDLEIINNQVLDVNIELNYKIAQLTQDYKESQENLKTSMNDQLEKLKEVDKWKGLYENSQQELRETQKELTQRNECFEDLKLKFSQEGSTTESLEVSNRKSQDYEELAQHIDYLKNQQKVYHSNLENLQNDKKMHHP